MLSSVTEKGVTPLLGLIDSNGSMQLQLVLNQHCYLKNEFSIY